MRSIRAVIAVLAVAAALALVAVAARSGRTETLTPIVTASGTPALTLATGTAQPSGEAPHAAQPPNGSHFGTIMLTLLGVALLVLIVALLIGRRRGRRLWWGAGLGLPDPVPYEAADPRPIADVAPVLTAVDAGLRRIEEGEPGDAVIACWVLLEAAAAGAGTAPSPAETPAELVARVLTRHEVTAEPLRRLADLYRTARYSTHPLGEDARAEAQHALTQVRAELTGHAAEAPR